MAFIVLTFGANQKHIPLAAAAAAASVLVVIAAGAAARAPLARVPENTMKFAVGVMLSSFGMFWGAEGAGANWPGGDAALLALIPGLLIAANAIVWMLRRVVPLAGAEQAWRRSRRGEPARAERMSRVQVFFSGVWDFVVGDDWRTALGVVLALGLTALVAETSVAAWWIMPLAVLVLLALSIRRAARGATRSG